MTRLDATAAAPAPGLAGRTALVTGGTGALGAAVAVELSGRGMNVVVTARREEPGSDGAAAGSGPHRALVDLADPDAVVRAVDDVEARHGPVDVLVHAAGGWAGGTSWETPPDAWRRMLDLNLMTFVHAARAVMPGMKRRRYGRVVVVGSAGILRGGGAGNAAYAVSKAALLKLAEVMADEVRPYGVHVHCVLPGTMDTPQNRRAMPDADRSTWVTTEEVARVIRALLDEDFAAASSVAVPVER